MKLNFNLKYTCIALVVLALLIFAFAPKTESYEPYCALGVLIVAGYIFFSFDKNVTIFTDPKKLWNYFRTKTATGSFPGTVDGWETTPPDERVIVFKFPLCLYVWIQKSQRRACVLNAIISDDKPVLKRLWSPKVINQASRDWIDDLTREAFGTDEIKSEQKMIDFLRGKGYEVTYKKKGKEDDVEKEYT